MFFLYFRGRVEGIENVPRRGPLVVVGNHGSHLDPPILSGCVNRPVAYMAKEELFEVPILKHAIALYGAYPVKRDTFDRRAIRTALEASQKGWAVGLFLEGTRTPDARIYHPKLGAALIAAKTQAPLLPVSLWGTEKILVSDSPIPRPVPVTVRIGQLISPPKTTRREDLQRVTDKCTSIINAMHDLGR